MKKSLRHFFICIPLALALSACGGVEYVDNLSLREGSYLSAQQKMDMERDKGKLRQFGALVIGKKKKDGNGQTVSLNGEDTPRVFMLKRNRDAVRAETLLFDNTDESKAMFKRTYLSFGADRKQKTVGLQLRLIY